jgi:hypothetical protein
LSLRRATPLVVVLLVLAGTVFIALRLRSRPDLVVTRGDSFWRLHYEVGFTASQPGARLHVAFPFDTRHSRVFRQEFSSGLLGIERLKPPRVVEAREIVAVASKAGQFRVTADFDLHLARRPAWRPNTPSGKLSAEERQTYLRSEKGVQVEAEVVAATLDELRDDVPGKVELVERVFEYCVVNLGFVNASGPEDAVGAIESGTASPLGRARAMVALCRAAKIPARLVTGFEVKRGTSVPPNIWVEVNSDGHWESYDPENGFARGLPRNFIPVRHNAIEVVRGTNASDVHPKFSIERLPPPPGATATEGRGLVEIVDLTRLPLESHKVLSLILLMPVGALVTSIFRTIIGIRTFGTFTPALLALSFVYADWQTGLFVFAAAMVVGLGSRSLLDRLKLLVVPRLSVMLTLVVAVMVFGVSLLDYLDLTRSAQAVLLPMVIMTMTVERFYVNTEQDGIRAATKLLAGTLLVAFCCYLLLKWDAVGELFLVHPEIHCFTIAALILIGRYTGYRLTELWRFRDLVGPED